MQTRWIGYCGEQPETPTPSLPPNCCRHGSHTRPKPANCIPELRGFNTRRGCSCSVRGERGNFRWHRWHARVWRTSLVDNSAAQSVLSAYINGTIRENSASIPALIKHAPVQLFFSAERATKLRSETVLLSVNRTVINRFVTKAFQSSAFQTAVEQVVYKSMAEHKVKYAAATQKIYSLTFTVSAARFINYIVYKLSLRKSEVK